MPQLYTQSMYGSYFSPNPGISTPDSSFKDLANSRRPELFYIQANDSFDEVHPHKILGAKPNSYTQTSALDPSFGFLFASPPLTQGSPVIYTPQKNSINNENFPYNTQNWTPDGNHMSRQSPITASRLSFNESYSPSNTTVDGSVQESSFWEDDEASFSVGQNFPSGNMSHPGLGIISNSDSQSIPTHTFKVEQLTSNLTDDEKVNHDIDLFLKEDPFADAVKTEDWFSDSQQYDQQMQPFEVTNREAKLTSAKNTKRRQGQKKESPFIQQDFPTSEKPNTPTSRKLRKAKSFGCVGKYTPSTSFSLENCLNEFHVKEGKFLFQDETARVLKQLGSPFLSRRKSAPKLAGSIHPLKKGKASSSLCLRAGLRSNEGTMKDMESRLGLFKVQLKSANVADNNELVFSPQEPQKSEHGHSWKDYI